MTKYAVFAGKGDSTINKCSGGWHDFYAFANTFDEAVTLYSKSLENTNATIRWAQIVSLETGKIVHSAEIKEANLGIEQKKKVWDHTKYQGWERY